MTRKNSIESFTEQALFPLSGSQLVSPTSATLGQAFSFNYSAGITRVSSLSKGFEMLSNTCQPLRRRCGERGVKVAWFGAKDVAGFTSCHRHWSYVGRKERPATEALLTWCDFAQRKNFAFLSFSSASLTSRSTTQCPGRKTIWSKWPIS